MSDDPARPCQLSRREFCAHACEAASLLAIGALAQSCGGGGNPAAPTSGGSAALVRTSAGNLLVAHIAQDTFTTLTATCTHEACTITGFQSSAFVCPCHGSRFNTGGAVLNGPATRALRTFAAQFAGTSLSITV